MRWQPFRRYASAVVVLMLNVVAIFAGCATETRGHMEGTPGRADVQRRCAAGSGDACAELAVALAVPNSDDKDFERGLVLLEVACGQRTPRACAALARLYLHDGVEAARKRARDLATRGCARHEAESCTVMGEVIRAADHTDFLDASAAFRDGCELGDPRGCELFGVVQWDDDLAGDTVAGMAALERACAGGRLTACHQIGVLRVKDPKTRDSGWALIAQNCRRGHVPSCSIAAYATAPLISAKSECAQSLDFAERACAGGQANACAVAMVCRPQPLGGAPPPTSQLHDACIHRVPLACLYWADQEEARANQHPPADQVVHAYNAACRGGFPAEEVACARAQALALDRAKDSTEAEPLISALQNECSNSSREACCALGDAYRDGKGVAADAEKARSFRAKACDLGVARCCDGAATPPGRPR